MQEDHERAPRLLLLLLLRHGQVQGHRGDVPVTAPGVLAAQRAGRALAAQAGRRVVVLTGATLRTRQTGEALAEGARAAGAAVEGPRVAFAVRNPDLYLAGERVDMVTGEAAFAAQVEGLDPAAVGRVPFFRGFLTADDPVGWWLTHPSPPGEDAAAVARRIEAFAASLGDRGPGAPGLTVAVTHSPVLRACALHLLGGDLGEPGWVSGLEVEVGADRSLRLRPHPPPD